MNKHKVLILGTGPAGLTAAIYAARANLEPVIIEGLEPGGQLTQTTEVENFPGFVNGIMGPELMMNMRQQAERFGAKFVYGWVTSVDFEQKPLKVIVNGVDEYFSDSVIVSTGATAKSLGIPGEQEMIGRGVSMCATCDAFFFKDKKVVVVGGGDSAMEEANFLTKFASEVTIVHRRNELRASKVMQERARNNPKIKWMLGVTPTNVVHDGSKVTGLELFNTYSGEKLSVHTDAMFVAIGHTPNVDFLGGKVHLTNGYITVKGASSETLSPGVFACGDVMDPTYKQAITAAGSGCKAAIDVERYLEKLENEHSR